MKRILFLVMHRPDRSPSQRFRYEQYLKHLSSGGFEYELSWLVSEKDDKFFYRKGYFLKKVGVVIKAALRRVRDCYRAGEFDIIFIQREAFMLGTPFFERLLSRSKTKMIFDFDDAIWKPDISSVNPITRFLKNPSKTARLIRYSDLVFAGNQFLANYAKRYNDHVEIVPTTIDTDEYVPVPGAPKPHVTIGWSGSFSTIKHFLLIVPVLTAIRKKFGKQVSFRVIGDQTFKHEALGIHGEPWSKAMELAVMRDFDIGVMPLPDDEWSKGKCGLKGLQYMALEIATIMSPVGVNREIIEEGRNGYLASTEEEWTEKLSILIMDKELRKKIGRSARQTVIEYYSVESLKEQYVNHFRELSKS